jgi:UDP-N-acetylglucosamine:LPS N-acetylglucosamine transferase
MLVCSAGGHLTQLYRLRPWWQQHERTWVTFPGPQAESLLAGENWVPAYFPTTRNLVNATRNVGLAARLIRAERPDLIVSDGAGVAFPFFLVGRTLGVRTVYLEVYDRISRPTLTGRLCYPFAGLFLLQWPEQAASYDSDGAGARACQPAHRGDRRHRPSSVRPAHQLDQRLAQAAPGARPLVLRAIGRRFGPA